MKASVLSAAQAELEEAKAYYLEHATPLIATAFVDDYRKSVLRLLQFPFLGRLVSPCLRRFPLQHFPYSLIYQATDQEVIIHAIAHHRRRPT